MPACTPKDRRATLQVDEVDATKGIANGCDWALQQRVAAAAALDSGTVSKCGVCGAGSAAMHGRRDDCSGSAYRVNGALHDCALSRPVQRSPRPERGLRVCVGGTRCPSASVRS